jgi:hypothetical protein
MVVVARSFPAPVEPRPGTATVGTGVIGDDVPVMGNPHPQRSTGRIGRPRSIPDGLGLLNFRADLNQMSADPLW